MFRSNKKARKLFRWWVFVGALVGAMVVLFGIGWKRAKNRSQDEEEVPQRAEAPASAEENQD